MSNSTDQRMQKEFIDWLDQHPMESAIAVSLTFQPERSRNMDDPRWMKPMRSRHPHYKPLRPDIAADALRMYCRRLNYRAYGNAFNRGNARLAVIPIREGGCGMYDKHIHYHLQVEVPRGWSEQDWLAAAEQEWKAIRWASRRQNTFKPVTSDRWRAYLAKLRDKPSYGDAIDWMNLHVDRASA